MVGSLCDRLEESNTNLRDATDLLVRNAIKRELLPSLGQKKVPGDVVTSGDKRK